MGSPQSAYPGRSAPSESRAWRGSGNDGTVCRAVGRRRFGAGKDQRGSIHGGGTAPLNHWLNHHRLCHSRSITAGSVVAGNLACRDRFGLGLGFDFVDALPPQVDPEVPFATERAQLLQAVARQAANASTRSHRAGHGHEAMGTLPGSAGAHQQRRASSATGASRRSADRRRRPAQKRHNPNQLPPCARRYSQHHQ